MTLDRRALVDPELADLLDLPYQVASAGTLAALRAMPPRDLALDAAARAVLGSVRAIPGRDGAPEVMAQIYRPTEPSGPVGAILQLHGGGFVCGSARLLEARHRRLVAALGCVLVAVDYRLAPETPFPGSLNDAFGALRWLFDRAEGMGIAPQRIGVMGESAGGGLAAALALRTRGTELAPAFQHLIYPMLDDRTGTRADPHPFAGDFVWTNESNRFGWSALLGEAFGSQRVSPFAAPARARDLSGSPPTFIATAALDLLLEENIEYARRLTRAGVAVELHVYPGAFHGFDLHPTARIAAAARRDSLAALARFLETP